MKIGIITDPLDFKSSGIGNYTYNLVEKLLEIDKENEYILIHLKKNEGGIYGKTKEIIVPTFSLPPKATIRKNLILPRRLKEEKLDVIHEPSQITPLLFHQHFKRVITIHDLIPLIFPNIYGNLSRIYYKFVLSKAAKNSDRIIAPSEHSKKDIISLLNVPEEKILVVPYGLDERYRVLEDKKDIKRKFKITFPFILYVGSFEKRKNVVSIIKAFNKLKEKGIKHKLLLVGGKDREYAALLKTVIELDLKEDVQFMGHVSQEDLPGLYNIADLFVFPSSYEGFGLPPLEAMACGTPVITSNMSSLPEVVGDAGLKIDPNNIPELADAMYAALTDDELKKKLIKKGLERTKIFSWEKVAKETLKVYGSV